MSPYERMRTDQRLKYSITESQVERSLRGIRSKPPLMLKSLSNLSVRIFSCGYLCIQNSLFHLSGKHFFLHPTKISLDIVNDSSFSQDSVNTYWRQVFFFNSDNISPWLFSQHCMHLCQAGCH